MHRRGIAAIRLLFGSPEVAGHDRSMDRYRRAALSSLAAMSVRLVTILTNLITVPLTLSYLGAESFGLWMTLTSFMLFLSFSDLGLGTGLQNRLASCHGRDDKENPSYYISSGLLVMISLFVVFIALAVAVMPRIDLVRLLGVHDRDTARQVLPTAQAMLIAFGFGLVAGMVQRIYTAHQRGYWGYAQMAVSNLLTLGGILLCIRLRMQLPILAVIFVAGPFLVPLAGSIVLFWRQEWLRPSFRKIRWVHTRDIFSIGTAAMWAQLATMVLVSGPAPVIANRIAVAAVTPFSVTQKLLGALTTVLMMSLWPLWPAYTEAAARGDWPWIHRTFWRTAKFSALIIVPCFAVTAVAGRWIIRLWTGQDAAVPSWSLLMAWNVWTMFRAWTVVCVVLLSGLNRLAGQATYGLTIALSGLVVAYLLAPTGLEPAIWWMVLVGEGLLAVALTVEVMSVLKPGWKPDQPKSLVLEYTSNNGK